MVMAASAAMPGHPRLDLLFIDSLHTEKQLRGELKKYAPLVRRGGFILLHDINTTLNADMYPAFTYFIQIHPNYHLFLIRLSLF